MCYTNRIGDLIEYEQGEQVMRANVIWHIVGPYRFSLSAVDLGLWVVNRVCRYSGL